MTEPIRRILKCWHDHGGGVAFHITRHDDGMGPVYRLEGIEASGSGVSHQLLSWGSEDKAKRIAAKLLEEADHQCGETCQDWQPV